MDERRELRVEISPVPRWFAPETLRPLYHLNRRLLDILIDESGRQSGALPSIAALGEKLGTLDDEVLGRLARIPICLVEAEFQREEAWSASALNSRTGHVLAESPLPRARVIELAGFAFGLASTTAQASQESARLIFGMRPKVTEAFAGFTVDFVQWLGQARAHWVRPRWYDRPKDWERLISTAKHAEAARLPPVAIRAMNRMLADLEPATRIEAETRHLHR